MTSVESGKKNINSGDPMHGKVEKGKTGVEDPCVACMGMHTHMQMKS
jgi:hypothetical protein